MAQVHGVSTGSRRSQALVDNYQTYLCQQALGLAGGIIGGPPAGWVADRWGRKISVSVNGILYAAGYAIIAIAKIRTLNHQTFKGLLMVGRFITGVASGWSFVSVPVSVR